MAGIRYEFDPQKLEYIPVKKGFWHQFRNTLLYILSSIVSGAILLAIFITIIDSPKEKSLKRENAQLRMQYEVMNKQLAQVEDVLEDMQQRDDNIYRVIFEADPIPSSIRKAGFGGTNRYQEFLGMENSNLVISTKKRLDIISKQLYVQSKSFDEIIELSRDKEKMLHSIPAIMPLNNKDLKRTASGWGYRIHPIDKIRKFHYGMDFTAPIGTDVFSSGNGKVKKVIRSRRGYGNHIIVDHGYGYETLYAHLNGFNVRRGQHINRGDIIGYVGNSGRSTGPHLHYEVRYKGRPVNPKNYYYMDLTPEEYEEMIELASNYGQTFD